MKEAVSKIMNFLKELYNAARQAINTVIQAARDAAVALIDKATKFVQEELNDFARWAQKGQ